ncbi:hypothetical protein [Paraflavitalea speifideaquila]|uniref:hypothetical protein n=1 Tax=Paraflavitalea speifideaquila TaxID=3076558 RepID=UPI0028E6C4D9|nr:hypothetical protein [Paraflavitalea speifideiaquila]
MSITLSSKKTNEALVKENEQLRNQLRQNFEGPDTTQRIQQDTIAYDTLGHYRKYLFRAAKVINNSVNFQNNYFTIHRGENQGIKEIWAFSAPPAWPVPSSLPVRTWLLL